MAEGGIAEKVLLREVQVVQCPLVKSNPAVTTTRLDREEAGNRSRPTASECVILWVWVLRAFFDVSWIAQVPILFLSYETGRHILTRTRASNHMEAQESIERHTDAYRLGLQPVFQTIRDGLEEVPFLWLRAVLRCVRPSDLLLIFVLKHGGGSGDVHGQKTKTVTLHDLSLVWGRRASR